MRSERENNTTTLQVDCPCRMLLSLVHEQLIVDGHIEAADALVLESGASYLARTGDSTDAESARPPTHSSSGVKDGYSAAYNRGDDAVLRQRLFVQEAIYRGDTSAAIELLSTHPSLFQSSPMLAARMHQQAIIDVLIAGSGGASALQRASTMCCSSLLPLLTPMSDGPGEATSHCKDTDTDGKDIDGEAHDSDVRHMSDSEAVADIVHRTCLLLSIPWSLLVDMTESRSDTQGVHRLLTPQHRVETAQYVNAAMLTAAGLPAVPRLQVLLQWVRFMEEKEQTREETPVQTEEERSGPPASSRPGIASILWPASTGPSITPTAADVVTLQDVLLGPRLITGGLALPPAASP
jgi:hypothetical protein